MARDTLTITKPVRGSITDLGTTAAWTAFTQGNGQQIYPKRSSNLALLVFNSKAGAIAVTIKKGVSPPALAAGQGDLTFSVSAQNKVALCVFDAGRFLQADGSVQIDTDAGATGGMVAIELPV